MNIDSSAIITSEQISKIASLLKELRPAYKELIDFYEEIFIAQEESKAELDLDPIIIKPDMFKLKIDNGISLIDPSEFIIDSKQAKELLIQLCNIAKKRAPHLNDSAEKIITKLSNNNFEVEPLFSSLLKNDYEVLKNISKHLDINEDILLFFGFEAISPCIQNCSEQLSHYFKSSRDVKQIQEGKESVWKKGTCPICGNIAQMGCFSQNGEKYLICSFCLHRWKTSRMGCSLCQNREKDKQHYFFNEEEKEYRVDLCDNCKQYVKIVDLRELTRTFYPPLEQLCTIHLDMQAEEQGYRSLVGNRI